METITEMNFSACSVGTNQIVKIDNPNSLSRIDTVNRKLIAYVHPNYIYAFLHSSDCEDVTY